MALLHYCPHCGNVLPRVDSTAQVDSQTCSACGAVHYQNAKPSVSTVVVHNGQILLALRAHQPYAGWWNLPGGFLDAWEHPAEGAVREVAEETGLAVRVTHLVDVTVYRYGEDGDYLLNLFYSAEVIGGALNVSNEVTDLRWFGLDCLPEKIAFLHDRRILTRSLEFGADRGDR